MRAWTSATLTMLLFTVGVSLNACDTSGPESTANARGEGAILADGTVFTRAALLEAFGQCIFAEVEQFEAQSQAFARVANENRNRGDERNIDQVRTAWEDAIDVWQRLELMQVGPAGRSTHPGGQHLREAIYPWPHRDHCEIDQNLVNDLAGLDPDEVSPKAKGLWAAEYLLFNTDSQNACEPEDEINVSGSWAALDADTLNNRRADYAALNASAVADVATTLLDSWAPSGQNFLAELTAAGNGSRTYGNKRVAVNAVSDALGYIDWGIKDKKLAQPLGLVGCENDDCSQYLEARYSRRSKAHLRNNMLGFRKIFTGCGPQNEGLGFDDYLDAMGAGNIGANIDRTSQAVLEAIDGIEESSLLDALNDDPESVQAVLEQIRALSNLLRTEFLVALNLELPQMVQGDND